MLLKETIDASSWLVRMLLIVSITVGFGLLVGCAEGPLWRAGKYSPWAKNQWAEEERIADTLFVQKRRMTESVNAVIDAPIEDQQKIAGELAEVLHRNSVLLLRLHAVKLLGQINCPASISALKDASDDHTSDIRIASIKAWSNMPPDTAIPQLQEMIGNDTDTDVRLAATRALGNFSGKKAVAAISLALDDRDPALQLRATESLQKVTGEQLGRDIGAWQEYVASVVPQPTASSRDRVADQSSQSTPSNSSGPSDNSFFQ